MRSLKDNLFRRTIVEHPTLHICTSQHHPRLLCDSHLPAAVTRRPDNSDGCTGAVGRVSGIQSVKN